jgi:hypothetical protein
VGTAAPANVVPSALDPDPFEPELEPELDPDPFEPDPLEEPPVVPLLVPVDPVAPLEAPPAVVPEALTVDAVLDVDVW